MTRPVETPLVQTLPATVPFVGPEAIERRRAQIFKARIGANESVFGPSPRVLQVLRDASAEAWMYGDPESYELREALAAGIGCAREAVVIGEGIDALLGYAVRLYVGAGDHVVTSDGAYPTFNYHVAGYGGSLIKVPYRDDKEDIEGLLAAAEASKAKMIYLSNPDNPMGSWHEASVIEDMIARLPFGCMLLLDEAYVEFAPDGAVPNLSLDDPRVIRMRTFSKAYGMAGLRVGYAYGEGQVIRGFEKIRNHFGMNRLSQAAALAAINDPAWLDDIRRLVAASCSRIGQIARDNGFSPLPSATNFVTMDCGADAGFARAVLQALEDRDVFVRMPFAAPGNRCIRITAAPDGEIDRFAEALPGAIKAAKAIG
ncbi:pyridoxal phosphate-dependent aminotransferase [Rhodobacteraceae bacterium]|nr:pyridoxal phosphate-dependent aminotransferase [Paracoccaceae bacterium]